MSKPSSIVPVEDNKIVPFNEPNRLIKRTIFDMQDAEFTRLKGIAQVLAISTFNPSKDGKKQRTDADFLMIMLKGMELGFSPLAAVDFISVINGKPSVDGKGMLAIAYASNVVEDIKINGNETSCTVTVKRKGINNSFQFTFTIEDAKRMELLPAQGKTNNYTKQPKVMLKWRAVSGCLREALPDYLGGLYTKEELAPQNTLVADDGSMELHELPASPAPQLPEGQAPVEDIEDVDKALGQDKSTGDKWLADVTKYCTPFYIHDNHRNNSIALALQEGYIQRTMKAPHAGALMLMHCATKPIQDGGLELHEDEVFDALGGKISEYMKIEGNDFQTAWMVLKLYDLRKTQESQSQAETFDDIPM